jgi:hypothetical protein
MIWPAIGALVWSLLLSPQTVTMKGAGAEAAAQEAPEGFRQGVRYTIEATLDEAEELLRGAAILDYQNRSPDTLSAIYLHLHLNAFRPNSLWARLETRAEYDFRALMAPNSAFERLLSARADGISLAAEYPHAPDSTVVRLALPSPLPPDGSVRLAFRWEARPSTLCRRQCRAGRHYDFAQWYPRIAVYDVDGWQQHPLYPQGEFYGEFGTYDVTLDLAEDQVVGATGVPLSGDPGWRSGRAGTDSAPPYQRSFYGAVPPPLAVGLLQHVVEPGRKRVRFFAEDVHHFAWSVDPRFRYEGVSLPHVPAAAEQRSGADVAIHAIFRPEAEDTWGDGVAIARTIAALRWLEEAFGPYPYPQLTVLHRLEGGGTEFPMLVMNGSASEGLIFHEVAHQYVHAIFANNEWRDTWLDEGFAVFLGNWYREQRSGPEVWEGPLAAAVRLERFGLTEPVSTEAKDFSSFQMYGAMSYSKAALIFRMLRDVLGEESFRRMLREYYERYRFRHVDEDDLRGVAEQVSGRPLEWFFDAWLHGTGRLDYAIRDVRIGRQADGKWLTEVEIERLGEIWMPIAVAVDDVVVRAGSSDSLQVVKVLTDRRPAVVELDPASVLLDADRSNNRSKVGN